MLNSASEFGKELGLVHEMVVAGRGLGADRTFYVALANNKDLLSEVIRFVDNSLEHRLSRPSFRVYVDYRQTRSEMFAKINMCKIGGHTHDGHEYDFSMLGHSKGKVRVSVEAFRFFLEEKVVDIIAKLDELGYRPAHLEEELALIAQYPEESRKLMSTGRENFIALGSVGAFSGSVPVSPHASHFEGFSVGGSYVNGTLNSNYWILAVKKGSEVFTC